MSGKRPPAPLRLRESDIASLARLAPECAGLLINWGWQNIQGRQIEIAKAQSAAGLTEREWNMVISAATPFLKTDAIEAGLIIVKMFADAAAKRREVSSAKIRIPAVQKPLRANGTTGKAVGQAPKKARSTTIQQPVAPALSQGQNQKNGDVQNVTITAAITATLTDIGITSGIADEKASQWMACYGRLAVAAAIAKAIEKHVTRPIPYIEKILANQAERNRNQMPSEIKMAIVGARLPRPVKKWIKPGARDPWIFEGWTARGHRRGGVFVDDRRAVWRTDAGRLEYMSARKGQDIPDYEEDAGVYEQD